MRVLIKKIIAKNTGKKRGYRTFLSRVKNQLNQDSILFQKRIESQVKLMRIFVVY